MQGFPTMWHSKTAITFYIRFEIIRVFLTMKVSLTALLLFALFNISAQPKLTFDTTLHDFGTVSEGDGAAIYDFVFKNTGTTPLVIQDVKTSCDCTSPEWTKQPVPPGETGFVSISYDVIGNPGIIDKTILVYSNSQPSMTRLRIVGEVIPVERPPAESFFHTAGTIRLDNMMVAFKRIYSGETSTLVVKAYNPGPDTVKISFINLPEHIKMEVTPETIKSGEIASIKVIYDAAKKNDWDFVYDHIAMILNDDPSNEYTLIVTATIQEDFSRWTDNQLRDAPAISFDRQIVDAGKIRKGDITTCQAKLFNNGKSKLLIRKIDSGNLTVNAPKIINAGDVVDFTVTFDSTGQIGEQDRPITVITNDPKKERIVLRFRAEVTE